MSHKEQTQELGDIMETAIAAFRWQRNVFELLRLLKDYFSW